MPVSNSFSPNTKILSSAVNTNFTEVVPDFGVATLAADRTETMATPHVFIDITGLSFSLTTSVTSNVVVWFSGSWSKNHVNAGLFRIVRDSTAISAEVRDADIGANIEHNIAVVGTDSSLAAGTYTYKVQCRVESDGATLTTEINSRIVALAWPT